MPNRSIPDWKKAAIVGLSTKYGYRTISRKLDVSQKTVRKYKKEADNNGSVEMDGIDLSVR